MPQLHKPNNQRSIIDWVIAGLGVILAVLLFFLVRQYSSLRRNTILRGQTTWVTTALRDRAQSAAASAETIQSWMTFDYVNKVFYLPPEYLKTRLAIADPRYPKLTIGEFAEDNHRGTSSTLNDARTAVQQYLTQSTDASST